MADDLHARSSLEEGIEAYLRHLERERNCAAHTVAAYRRDLVQFTRFLYPRSAGLRLPLNTIQHDAVDDFVRELEARGLRTCTTTSKDVIGGLPEELSLQSKSFCAARRRVEPVRGGTGAWNGRLY